MSISPLDVSKHEFARALRGYDPSEVQAFLERVADEFSALQHQVTQLGDQNRIFAAKLSAYQEMEKNLRDSLVAVQESQKATREQLDQERQQILREAQMDAAKIKLDTEREIMILREDLRAIQLHRDAFIKRLRFLMKAQSELMDLIEQESPELPHDRTDNPTS
jgi:cell division initiation protein